MAADVGGPARIDSAVAEQIGVGLASVARVRKRFCQEGLEAALVRRKHSKVRARRLDGEAEAHLIALACFDSPKGQQRWTLRLLATRMVELEYADKVSHGASAKRLKGGAQALVARLKELVADGRSTPGPRQQNDVPVDIWKLDSLPGVDASILDDY